MNNDNTGHKKELENNSSSLIVPSDNASPADYHEWRGEVYQALIDAGLPTEAEAFWRCGADHARYHVRSPLPVPPDDHTKSVFVCDHDPRHEAVVCKETCHLRICPDCARRASARLMARYVPVALELAENAPPGYRVRKIVLTTNVDLRDSLIKAKIANLRASVSKLFDKILPINWRNSQGFLVADEFGAQGNKLHFHVLFFGQFISNKAKDGFPLATAWSEVTNGECTVAYISGVNYEDIEHEIVETVKYVTKFWKADETGAIVRLSPDLMPGLLTALRGTRRVRSAGVFYGVPGVAAEGVRCPTCGEVMSRWTPLQWNIYVDTGWLPGEQERELFLIPGNKSPPTDGELGRSRPQKPGNGLDRAEIMTTAALPGMVADSRKHSSRFLPN